MAEGTPLRIVMLANGRVGREVSRWLREQGEAIEHLVLHPPQLAHLGDEIVAACGLAPSRVTAAAGLDAPELLQHLRELRPDLFVLAGYAYLLRPAALAIPARGALNLHPGYLPQNRGTYPWVWAIVDGTPAGATLHYLDAGVDTGDVVHRKLVEVGPADTAASLLERLDDACIAVVREAWPAIRAGPAPGTPQWELGPPSSHRTADIRALDRIDLDGVYTGRRLIDILRARTPPAGPGAYFEVDGRRVRIALSLSVEEPGR